LKEKEYYTLEEVHEYLNFLDNHRVNVRKDVKINREPFYLFGFKCINNFCLTQKGWVASHEECCPYCVHSIIKNHGSKEDKIKFNNNHDLGNNYIVPVTNKEVALNNKKQVKNKKTDPRRNIRERRSRKLARRRGEPVYEYITNKELKESLKLIKSSGISIIRRGKKNLWDDIFRYSLNPEEFIYVKGLKAMVFIPHISEGENVEEYLKDEIVRQNKRYGLNIILPD